MSLKKMMLAALLASALLATGCGNGGGQPSSTAPEETDPSISEPEEGTVAEEPTEAEEPSAPEPTEGQEEEGMALLRDEYDGLVMTAAVLERKAILPGSSIPLTVNIQNEGDKTIVYTQGSGSFETPQALSVPMSGLQKVLPKDHLGIATLDFVTKELKPGESLQFVLTLLAIEPHASFDEYTYELYNDEQQYIGEMEWAAIQEAYPDLVPAAAGSYSGSVIFTYLVLEEGQSNPMGEPTGFAQADFEIGVTG